MTTAATSNYNLSAQDMIDLALADIGAIGPGAPSDADLRPQALKLLNIFLKRLDVDGALLWHISRRTQSLTSGVASYALSNDVMDLDEPARYTASGATTGSQVTAMARDEYMTLPDRTLTGPVYRYYAEKGLDATGVQAVTLYLFPVPANTGDTLEYAAVLRMKDVTNLSQTLDVPQKWLQAVRFGFAATLGIPFGAPIDRLSYLNKRFDEERDRALGDDNERGNVQAVPFGVEYGYGQHSSGRYR